MVEISAPAVEDHILFSETWDANLPPIKKSMLKGHMVPTIRALQLRAQPRRVSIEIRGAVPYEKPNFPKTLGDKDIVILRVFKRTEDATSSEREQMEDPNAEYFEHKRYRLEDISVVGRKNYTCELKIGHGKSTVVRDIRFANETDAKHFDMLIDQMMELIADRTRRQIEKYRKAHQPKNQKHDNRDLEFLNDNSQEINILAEIVSAKGLPIADLLSSDPYVVVSMNGVTIHKTSVIKKTLNPVWTLHTGSLFLIRMPPEEFFAASGGILFKIKDYDSMSSSDTLGSVKVPLVDAIDGKGQRKAYKVIGKDPSADAGTLFLRFRPATQDEINFLSSYEPKERGVFADETYLGPGIHGDTAGLKQYTKKGTEKEVLHRAKPFPDPARPQFETEWMTRENLHEEALKPSKTWIEAGSGNLGKLYVEVIGCDDLPNMDKMNLNPLDKTDAFVCLAFEDSAVNTDVIADELSPRWMPWSRRAFAFNISHLSSSLYVGIFDYDPKLSPTQIVAHQVSAALHDRIARCVICMADLAPGTVNTLTYNLYDSDDEKRRSRGRLIIRLRVELENTSRAAVKSILPPDPLSCFLAVKHNADYDLIHYTAEGKRDFIRWNLSTFTDHIEELHDYLNLIDNIIEALIVLWLWRGHYRISVCNNELLLPLHSLILFIWVLLISWNFDLLASFGIFSIAWFFLAMNGAQRRNPSPWYQAPQYFAMFCQVFFRLRTRKTKASIQENENAVEYEQYIKTEEERQALVEKRREIEAQIIQNLINEYMEGLKDTKNDAQESLNTNKGGGLITKVKGMSIDNLGKVDPVKKILYPIQLELGNLVLILRSMKNVAIWRQPVYAFWITTICLLGAFIVAWLPVWFLFRWGFRLILIPLTGPWMMIFDRLFFREKPGLSVKEREANMMKNLKMKYALLNQLLSNQQIHKEDRRKAKAMKQYLYGKYLQLLPHFIRDLSLDRPLLQSKAEIYNESIHGTVNITQKVYGQMLSGNMIPKRAIEVEMSGRQRSKSGSSIRRIFRKVGKAPIKLFGLGRKRNERNKTEATETAPLLDHDDATYESIV